MNTGFLSGMIWNVSLKQYLLSGKDSQLVRETVIHVREALTPVREALILVREILTPVRGVVIQDVTKNELVR
ncbi:hypothetical protein ALGA_3653 [Labilibaculum antarcticum]|uniref:Uncharacterized protein n=1 Tax=Labilibaculum antarcticum TaxID=1717717 RepID=A0A1Y1CNK6_9BACT|nr:hypothetical protein ALGA_3653 [Labilibaculum antarcticum]